MTSNARRFHSRATAQVLVDNAFNIFQRNIDARPCHVAEARRRRDVFRSALMSLRDIVEVLPSGSLARGTQVAPIHDVDLVAILEPHVYGDWSTRGSGANAALLAMRSMIERTLGADEGVVKRYVVHAEVRNHVVQCRIESRIETEIFAGAFTVEVMPALRAMKGSCIPVRCRGEWEFSDPEFLIKLVAKRHREWAQFAGTIRMVKAWNRTARAGLKSLSVEVLAVNTLPRPRAVRGLRRTDALEVFFRKAASAVIGGVGDPAGLCGSIQPDLDEGKARQRLLGAAER